MDKKLTLEESIKNNTINPVIKYFKIKRINAIIGFVSIIFGAILLIQQVFRLIEFIDNPGLLLIGNTDSIPKYVVRIIICSLTIVSGIFLFRKRKIALFLYSLTSLTFIIYLIDFDINALIYGQEIFIYFHDQPLHLLTIQFLTAFLLIFYFRLKGIRLYFGILNHKKKNQYFLLFVLVLLINYIPYIILPSMII